MLEQPSLMQQLVDFEDPPGSFRVVNLLLCRVRAQRITKIVIKTDLEKVSGP
jgi:hypothetical protein